MKTQHIPGPWRVTAHGGGEYTVEAHTETVATSVDETGEECAWAEHTEANARLIAAAPDLLEALQASLKLIELSVPFEGEVTRKARAAIAKATGGEA